MRIRNRPSVSAAGLAAVAAAGLLMLAGCSKPVPTVAEAAEQILKSEDFKTEMTDKVTIGFTLPAGPDGEPARTQSCSTCGALEISELARYDRDPNDPRRFVFVLTPKGQQAAYEWVEAGRPQSMTEGSIYLVAVAERKLLSIDQMRPIGDGVIVAFSWRWTPNEIGKTLGVSSETRRSDAFLRLYPIGWRLEGRIEGME